MVAINNNTTYRYVSAVRLRQGEGAGGQVTNYINSTHPVQAHVAHTTGPIAIAINRTHLVLNERVLAIVDEPKAKPGVSQVPVPLAARFTTVNRAAAA